MRGVAPRRAGVVAALLAVALVSACGSGALPPDGTTARSSPVSSSPIPSSPIPSSPIARVPAEASRSATAVAAATASAVTGAGTGTPTEGSPPLLDVRASRLRIPALGIDSAVLPSQVVPDTSPPTPGCPPVGPGAETLTVPERGIATPEFAIEGLENKVWVFGHSRWLGEPGLFFALQEMAIGDEVFVDGLDRTTGATVRGLRFVVDGLYLTDIESGGALVLAEPGSPPPPKPLVFLQTSVREDGVGKGWILSPTKLLAKARTLIQGDAGDPCKYLLLFVRGEAA